jgi:hypothetical protein
MALKGCHLAGATIPKETLRELALAGESSIATGDISGMTPWSERLLSVWPVAAWRERRRRNHARLSEALGCLPGVRVIGPCDAPIPALPAALKNRKEQERCAVPFSVVLLCRSAALAGLLRRGLMAASVHPASIWPLEDPVFPGIPAAHLDFSRRMLALHCDMRYGEEDLRRVAALVRRLCGIYHGAVGHCNGNGNGNGSTNGNGKGSGNGNGR